MLNKKSVDDLQVKGKRVLCRCDFNVPLKDGVITDENRIVAALPTIEKLISEGAKVILCSHLGKPKEPSAEFSLAPVAKRLSEKLGKEVVFAADDTVVGENAKAAVANMNDGDVVLLQNTRFRKEETKNGEAFSKELASLADCYVNDAFGTSHRAHCSTVGVTEFIEGDCAVGYLMEKEIEYLGNAVNNPVRPFAAILGGAKVSDKINVINNLLDKVDILVIGGGMAYTFFKALGYGIGKSILEEDKIDFALEMIQKAEEKGVTFLLPVDNVVAKEFGPGKPHRIASRPVRPNPKKPFISEDEEGFDIGTATVSLFADALKDVKTLVWNGPMGVFEIPEYSVGTKAVAEIVSNLDATTIVGGGDSAAAVNQLGFADKITHISTGGGASLEFLEGKVLPGVAAADDK
ncbi:MAG: phosphoglycerate kinase [Lachnospirales bacterium]